MLVSKKVVRAVLIIRQLSQNTLQYEFYQKIYNMVKNLKLIQIPTEND